MNTKKSKTAHKKMWDVKGIVAELNNQNLMTDDCEYYLDYGVNLDEDELKFLNSRQQPIGVNTLESSPGLEELAQVLNFYTPRGYDYVRDTMKLNLPHPQFIRKTFVHTNGKPGYSQEMFDLIKLKVQKSKKSPPCSLTVATMRLNWNEKADIGCEVDFGGPEQCDTESKEVLLFLVTFLNETLDIPVGFFVVTYIDQYQMLNMTIGCLELLHEAGVQIVALSAELDWTVFRAVQLLGCSFTPGDLKTTFDHPITKEPVALFLDPCKSIEYIRLALQANSPMKLVSTNSPPINWSHVERFMELLAKKNEHVLHDTLSKAHINLRGKQKGKVACWIMSESLAKCARIISQQLNAPELQLARPTVDFIEMFNKVYDSLSSRAIVASGPENSHKAPLRPDNFDMVLSFFRNTENYMKNVKGKKGNFLIQSEHPGEGMGYIGLLVCMHSAAFLYRKLVLTNQLNMLPLHKFSLEPIQMLMNNIRAKYGVKYYNDPKSRHVKGFFKTLVKDINRQGPEQKLKQMKKESILQNYSAVETINVTACRASIFDYDHIVDPKVTKDHDKTFKLIYSAPKEVLDFTNPIRTYVAGFVASFLFKVVTCEICNGALLADYDMNGKRASIIFHDDFGSVLPSKDVAHICEKTEWFIQHAIKTSHTLELKAKNLYKPILVNKVLESFVSTEIFDSIEFHQFDQGPTENHIVHLIRAIAEVYIDVRYRHLPTVKNMTGSVPDRYNHKPSYFKTGSKNDKRFNVNLFGRFFF